MTAVFDTNVLIAAIITEGVCSKVLHRARSREFSLTSCPFIMGELRRILTKKFRLTPAEASEAMGLINEAVGQVIEHDMRVTGVCRDSDDDNVLACALAAKADYLVTGDSDLLEVKSYRGFKIVTPRDFEAMFA